MFTHSTAMRASVGSPSQLMFAPKKNSSLMTPNSALNMPRNSSAAMNAGNAYGRMKSVRRIFRPRTRGSL